MDDTGATDGGGADSGATDGGGADSGATDGGGADSGATDGGGADSGAADGEGADDGTTDDARTTNHRATDPDVQTRKLQKVGGSTFTVSMPKGWAREHGLEAGDDVHLYGHGDGSLVVRGAPVDGGDLDAVTVPVRRDDPEAVERALRAAYTNGFEEIELVSDDGFGDEGRRAATSLARTLVGTDAVEVAADRIVVRNLLDPADVSVRQSLTHLQFVALSMHREATAAVADGTAADHVPDRDDEVDRLFAMIAHHVNRSLVDFAELDRLGLGRTELFEYYRTARQLERVADHAVAIANAAGQLEGPTGGETANGGMTAGGGATASSAATERGEPTASSAATASEGGTGDEPGADADGAREELVGIADDARQVVADATDAVLDGDAAGAAHAALDLRDATVADAEALDRALFERGSADAYRLTRVLDSLVRTARLGGNVAEIAVQSAMRERE